MDCWQILGIEPTKNEKDIKKAYATLLRIYNPEDDAEGYQRLRQAYDKAKILAKHRKEIIVDNEVFIVEDNISLQENTLKDSQFENTASKGQFYRIEDNRFHSEVANNAQNELASSVMKVLSSIEQLYCQYPQRNNSENWTQCLRDESLNNIDCRSTVDREVLRFLMGHYYLPQHIFKTLNDFFGWSKRELEFEKEYPIGFVNFIVYQISDSLVRLHYNTIFEKDKTIEEIERFFCARNVAYNAYCNNDYETAGNNIKIALAINSNDYDLMKIAGEYYRRCNEKQKALEVYLQLADKYPDRAENQYVVAKLLFENADYDRAKYYINLYLEKESNNEGLCLLGKCNLKLNDNDEYCNFEQAHEGSPNDFEPVFYLSTYYGKKLKSLNKSHFFHPFSNDIQHKMNEINRKRASLPPKLAKANRIIPFLARIRIFILFLFIGYICLQSFLKSSNETFETIPGILVLLSFLLWAISYSYKSKQRR